MRFAVFSGRGRAGGSGGWAAGQGTCGCIRLLLAGIVLALAGERVLADQISLVFDKIGIVELAKVAYGEMGKQPVVFTSEAVKAQEVVTLTLRNMDRARAMEQVAELLKGAGYSVENKAGVVWIDKVSPLQDGEFFYRPKYRAVLYLLDMLAPLFKSGTFTVQHSNLQQPSFYSPFSGPPAAFPSQTPFAPSGLQASPTMISQTMISQPTAQYAPGYAPGYDNTSPYGIPTAQDKEPDAFIFKGSVADRDRLQRLLAQIDTATPEVLVKAVVFEVSTDGNDQSAISLAAQLLSGRLGINLGNMATGDFSAVFKGTNFQAVINALSTDRRFKAVSSPQLRVQSGSTAQLTVGSETPVLGAVNYDNVGKSIQSVEYKSSGVILNLKPEIREDTANLHISQQISNFIQTTTGVNNSPTLIKRELQTTVGVRSEEVLVLGGLDQNTSTKEHAGISFLPSWLGSNSDAHSKTEVLLILQATRI